MHRSLMITHSVICANCAVKCTQYKEGKIDHSDVLSRCPSGFWPMKQGPLLPQAPAIVAPSTAGRRSPGPTLWKKLKNLQQELRLWRAAGYPVTPPWLVARRWLKCQSCLIDGRKGWNRKANLGLGGCSKCGCTKVKLWLKTSRCPHPKGPRW